MQDFVRLLNRAEQILDRLEHYLPTPVASPDWGHYSAYRWQPHGQRGTLQAILRPHKVRLHDLQCIDRQKALVDRNTRQFLENYPANNVLLWGPRGTGKSSLIKAILNEYADQGLRLVEVDRNDLIALPNIVEPLAELPYRFLIYCDDLSFEADDSGYKALKAALDGSVSATPDNVLLYATSNRRHLLPEWASDNQTTQMIDNELHHGEAVEEKISLSERFGIWLAFHPFSQDDYLCVVEYWLRQLGWTQPELKGDVRQAALQWALQRGSRSGRAAWQFARDWVGRHAIDGKRSNDT
jgi:predicted AAA+ superfamily ATPase